MPYAWVQDVAADWQTYERVVAALGDDVPEGLITHVAGPTDSGFRIIGVWDSREAWERFREVRLRPAVRSVAGEGSAREPVFSDLEVRHLLRG